MEEIRKQIELFNQGLSCTKIAKLCNTSVYKVIKNLKENGYTITNKQNKKPDCIDDFIKEYKKGNISTEQLAKKYNLSGSTIRKWLHKAGIETINQQNRTKFNETVFDSIDTEEKAYWLGFIYADGYISGRDNTFELSLSINDKAHLYKFNKFMQHESDNVKLDSYRCRWSIVNKHLWNVLNNYGCTPKKSLTLEFPDLSIFKDKSLIRHFIRGYFDGDGSIFISGRKLPKISVLGTSKFLSEINKYLLNDNNKLINNKNSDKTWVLTRGGSKAVCISYILYYKSTIYLDRKFKEYLKFINCRSNAKALELLEGKIGEGWDVNPELIADIKKLQQCNA